MSLVPNQYERGINDGYNMGIEEAAAVPDAWADATADALRLRGGEMTMQEIRTVRAFLRAVAFEIRALTCRK